MVFQLVITNCDKTNISTIKIFFIRLKGFELNHISLPIYRDSNGTIIFPILVHNYLIT